MLRDGASGEIRNDGDVHGDWQHVHQQLRGIARRRGELDAREATYLVEAEQRRLWTHVGCISMLDYLERELGYAPREAIERLRIARRLEHLPELHARLADGTFKLTAVRELARIATPDTEDVWIDAARGKTLRQIEQLVSGRKPGDTPDDEPGPDLEPRDVTFSLTPVAIGLLRQARVHLAGERGSATLTDSELVETLVRRALEPAGDATTGSAATRAVPPPAFQIAITTCRQCKRGWQHGGGREIEVDAATLEMAHCDAEDLGSLEAETPARKKTKISKRKRQHVFLRDHHRCVVPGCRSSRNLDVHHLQFQVHGGTHALWNLALLCSGHHRLLHAGALVITGRAPDRLTFSYPGRAAANAVARGTTTPVSGEAPCAPVPAGGDTHEAHGRRAMIPARAPGAIAVSSSSSKRTSRHATAPAGSPPTIAIPGDAVTALVGLGFKPAETRRALEIARAHVGHEPSLETWIREGLRACALARRMEDGASPARDRRTRGAPA